MIPSTILALSVVVTFGPGAQQTGHTTTIDPAIERADGAFLDGHYQPALEGYLQLYSRTREPNYLHNIASCYEKLGSFEHAIEYFTRYLEVGKDVGPGARAEVRRTIEHLRAAIRQRRGEGAAASPPAPVSPAPLLTPAALAPPASGSPGAPPSPPLAEWPGPATTTATTATTATTTTGSGSGPLPAPTDVSPPLTGVAATGTALPVAHDGRSIESLLRGAAIVEAGLGVAALGMGIYFGVHARNLEHQVTDGKVFDAYADREGQRASAYQYGMFTVGGALLAGSAAFFYCSYLAGQAPAGIAILPGVGANGAGGALAAKF